MNNRSGSYSQDEKYINRCIDLARQALGQVAPNPMVGSVLVCNNKIIGEGFHQGFGQAHAEVNAIQNVSNPELLKNSRLYVNLEPCSHHGKTPPCTSLILESKIPEVVIGTTDPNKLVAGKGLKILKNHGIKVLTGLLAEECKILNKRFFSWHLKKRPYIILKWASSSDGYIDFKRPANAPVGPNWITTPIARTLVHKWRSEEQAVMVGTNTVLKDNPRLNVRDWSGKNPLRVIIDRSLKTGHRHHIHDNSQDTLIFTSLKKPVTEPDQKNRTRYACIDFDDSAELQMLKYLYSDNIQSLIIEGGAFTLSRFIEKGLWDEARIFTGPQLFRGGIKAPEISGNFQTSQIIGNSILRIIYNT